MTLRPADLLGLPVVTPLLAAAVLRYGLVLLAAVWAWTAAGRRARLALLVGITFASVAVGFWVLCLQRPYGLLADASATRRLAIVNVAVATGDSSEGVLAGDARGLGPWGLLSARLRSPRLLLAPTLIPVLVLPALALLAFALWPARDEALLVATLTILFSTGDLDTARGVGLVSGLWSHPGRALVLVGAVALGLAVSRLRHRQAGTLAALGVAGLLVFLGTSGPGPSVAEALSVLTVVQGPWLILGLVGMGRGSAPAARALSGAGALLVLGGSLGLPAEPWTSAVLYRLGLILASVGPVRALLVWLGEVAGSHRWLARRAMDPFRLGLASAILLLAPASFLTWWEPLRLDPAAAASFLPVRPELLAAMDWIRQNTPPRSVFAASPEYAPAVAALGGRRVLRAPSLGLPEDDDRRYRTEKLLLTGQPPGNLLSLYGLSYLLAAPGDFLEHGLSSPYALDGVRGLSLRYQDPQGLRIYEVEAGRVQ